MQINKCHRNCIFWNLNIIAMLQPEINNINQKYLSCMRVVSFVSQILKGKQLFKIADHVKHLYFSKMKVVVKDILSDAILTRLCFNKFLSAI